MKRRLSIKLLALNGVMALVVAFVVYLWCNWAAIGLQSPNLSTWESPTGTGIAYIYWNHSLRPYASVFVTPTEHPEPLIAFGTFNDDDLRFDATFYWSRDGQVLAALDMPQWWHEVPVDENGATVERPIFTHACDFSTVSSIGYTSGEGGNATAFLERHERIEALMAAHGGRGDSFTVDDIRAREHRLSTYAWWRWSKRMDEAREPIAPER